MKRLFNLVLLIMLALQAGAKDELQIKPIVTVAGIENDEYEYYMEVILVNESFDIANLQFDLLFPEGVEYMDYEFDERVPSTTTKKGKNVVTEYDFSVQTNVLASGYTRFMFVPGGEMRKIEKGSGSIMLIYFKTSSEITPGIYPIKMTNIKLVESVKSAIVLNDVLSYVEVNEGGSVSPLQTEKDIDMSSMTGYVPSFVVEELNSKIATNSNLRSLNLSGVTELGSELQIPDNVVYVVGAKGGLKRDFSAQKSTVCLPFALNATQVAAIKEKGCEIEKLSGFNASTNTVSFSPVEEMAANTPYLVTNMSALATFADMDGISIGNLGASPTDVVQGTMVMRGSFDNNTISSDAGITYYAYNEANGEFVRIGSNASVIPFRAYLALSGSSDARSISIDASGTTGISGINKDCQESVAYTLQGFRTNNKKGLFIQGKKKFFIK
jgi:hypothetical protein